MQTVKLLTGLVRFGAVLSFTFLPATAHSQNDWPYAEISCDLGANQLTITERSAPALEALPKGGNIQSLMALTRLKTINGPAGVQDHRVPDRDFVSSCVLGKSTYKVRVAPWKFTSKINGMCGAYPPSTKLTVWRDGKRIVGNLVFAGFCNPPESEFAIESVSFNEKSQSSEIAVSGQTGPAIIKRLSFTELPSIERKNLFP